MPKEMLPLVDKPIIQYAVEEALASGIEEIIFVTGKGKSALEDHFDRSYQLENMLRDRKKDLLLKIVESVVPATGTIVYTRQNEPLGLGHAIWCARNIIGDEPFAVLLADDVILSDVPVLSQMIEQFDRLRASIVAIEEVSPQDTSRYGIIAPESYMDDVIKIKGLVEKPEKDQAPSNLAIIGRYILTPKIFDILGRGTVGAGDEIQVTDAMSVLLEKQPIFGYKFDGKRFDCGDKAGWQMANLAFSLERPELRDELLPFLEQTLNANILLKN
jgi:UTP--glucose-1-phosphate uridylyltransferase